MALFSGAPKALDDCAEGLHVWCIGRRDPWLSVTLCYAFLTGFGLDRRPWLCYGNSFVKYMRLIVRFEMCPGWRKNAGREKGSKKRALERYVNSGATNGLIGVLVKMGGGAY